MDLFAATADSLLQTAIGVVTQSRAGALATIDALRPPIYVTDAEGTVTQYNKACIPFAGRTPVVGVDRWCVTWKLFTERGDALPHQDCPMAVAILTRQPVRGARAIAVRPDGSQVTFMPFPTPLFDANGGFCGALNMLIDVSAHQMAEEYRDKAVGCRRLATLAADSSTLAALNQMARDHEAKWRALDPDGQVACPARLN